MTADIQTHIQRLLQGQDRMDDARVESVGVYNDGFSHIEFIADHTEFLLANCFNLSASGPFAPQPGEGWTIGAADANGEFQPLKKLPEREDDDPLSDPSGPGVIVSIDGVFSKDDAIAFVDSLVENVTPRLYAFYGRYNRLEIGFVMSSDDLSAKLKTARQGTAASHSAGAAYAGGSEVVHFRPDL